MGRHKGGGGRRGVAGMGDRTQGGEGWWWRGWGWGAEGGLKKKRLGWREEGGRKG